jgi:predicted nucleic acid-binding protein
VDAWRSGQFKVIVSVPIVEELERTLQKPYFHRSLTDTQSSRFLKLLRQRATVSPITASVRGIAPRPEDDVILATAASAKVGYLVTGDRKLQQVGTYQGVSILSPRRFLETLKHDVSEG